MTESIRVKVGIEVSCIIPMLQLHVKITQVTLVMKDILQVSNGNFHHLSGDYWSRLNSDQPHLAWRLWRLPEYPRQPSLSR